MLKIQKFVLVFFIVFFDFFLICCERKIQPGLLLNIKDDKEVLVFPKSHQGVVSELIYANSYMLASTMEKSLQNLVLDPKDAHFGKEEIESYLQGMLDYFSGKKLDEDYLGELDKRILELKSDLKSQRYDFAKKYFHQLAESADIIKTESGLMYKVLKKGNGDKITSAGQRLNIDYQRNVFDEFSLNKKKFVDNQERYEFTISTLPSIGLIEGVLLMREGDEYEFYIIPELGYSTDNQDYTADDFLIFNVKINKIL